jgi:multimeric flavodoxin WrbA
MKAILLLATLKKEGQTNTGVLCDFFTQYLKKEGVSAEVIKLVDYSILPGTYLDMGEGDDWPQIFDKIKQADIILFATPIWWGTHSSQMQLVIERLDEVHDEIQEGKESQLAGKVGGIIVTGDSDGSQHIIGNIANFYNVMGISFPPQSTLTVIYEGHVKGEEQSPEELLKYYTEEYGDTAETMAKNLVTFASYNN